MNSVVFIIAGMLLGWFLEWLYVYVTKSVPKKNEIKQLKATAQKKEQEYSEATAKTDAEIQKLTAQVTELTALNESREAEINELKEELSALQQTAEAGAEEFDQVVPDDVAEPAAQAVELSGESEAQAEQVVADGEVMNDDMTQLTGVGPKTAELLTQAGLVSFTQLAEMDGERLLTLLQDKNIPHSKAKAMGWPEQAAQLVKGG